MLEIILFLGTFLIVFIVYLLFVIRRGKYLNKFLEGKEIKYLKKVYKVKITKDNEKKIALLVALSNSFIISVAVAIVCLFNNIFLQMIIGFISVITLILLCYHIIGKIFGGRK